MLNLLLEAQSAGSPALFFLSVIWLGEANAAADGNLLFNNPFC